MLQQFQCLVSLIKIHGLVLKLNTLGHRGRFSVLQIDGTLNETFGGVAVTPGDHALALQTASGALALELSTRCARASETIALRRHAVTVGLPVRDGGGGR